MPNMEDFSLKDMVGFSAALRRMGSGAASMEEVSDRIVHFLYDNLTDKKTGEKTCVLVRLFKTHPYGELDPDLQGFAQHLMTTSSVSPAMKCLVLLATAGLEPEWNFRNQSRKHRALPLPGSEYFIEAFPMVGELVGQMGLEINSVLQPDPEVVADMAQRTFNVFLVTEAKGSAYIPAQDDFVIPFGVRSVLGFGGILPSGNLFVIILFSKTRIPRNTADLFKTLALSAKIALFPFDGRNIFL
jgi:hypothetical protein